MKPNVEAGDVRLQLAVDEQAKPPLQITRGSLSACLSWCRTHWLLLTIATISIVGLGLGLGLGLGCKPNGCPPKKATPTPEADRRPQNLRVLARSLDINKRIYDVIASLGLGSYVTNTFLNGTAIEFLDFPDITMLETVLATILENKTEIVEFAVRDVSYFPALTPVSFNDTVSFQETPIDEAALQQAVGSLLPATTGSLLDRLQQDRLDNGSTGSLQAQLQEHGDLVIAALAAEQQLTDASRRMLADAGSGVAANDSIPWHLKRVNVPEAWSLAGRGSQQVVVAVLDTGFDVNHPKIKPNLWYNPSESVDGADNDKNGYIDDITGVDVAGSICTGDWRKPPPPAASPPPRSGKPSPPSTSPAAMKQCYDTDVSPESWDTDGHGTHVAGIVAAAANTGAVGISGVAPLVKLMLLKVFGLDGHTFLWASHIVAGLSYAYTNGAHIVVCSFSPKDPVPNQPPSNLDRDELSAFASVAKQLDTKNMLLFASAGNNGMDLNAVVAKDKPFLPCSLNKNFSSVMCVAATDLDDKLWAIPPGSNKNTPAGSNFGDKVVDIAAPGIFINSTVPVSIGSYAQKNGTSMATPLVAGVAALVASAAGPLNIVDGTETYYLGPFVKDVLLGTATRSPGLSSIKDGRLASALKAVQAVYNYTDNTYLLTPSYSYYKPGSDGASVFSPGLKEEYFAAVPKSANITVATANLSSVWLPAEPFDMSIRTHNASSSATSIQPSSLKYNASDTPTGIMAVRLSGLLYLPASPAWRVRLTGASTAFNLSRVQLAIGQRRINLSRPATLAAPVQGYYDFELIVVPGSTTAVELQWTTAGKSAATFSSLPTTMLFAASFARATNPSYAPNTVPDFSASSPPGWNLAWDYVSQGQLPSATQQLPRSFLRTFSAGVPPSTGPLAALRYTAVRTKLFNATGAFGSFVQEATQNAAVSTNASMLDASTTGAYGVAVAHLKPFVPQGRQIQLRVTCSSCVLYVQDLLVANASQALPVGASASPQFVTAQSGCLMPPALNLNASTGYVLTLELRFAVGDISSSSSGIFDVQYRLCSSTGQWNPINPMLTSTVMWAPKSEQDYTRGALRCDVWEYQNWTYAVPSSYERTPLASFTFKRGADGDRVCTGLTKVPENCTAVVAANVQAVLPASIADDPLYRSKTYSLRCWAFWSGTFKNGSMGMRSASKTADSGSVATANTYLQNQLVFRSIKGQPADNMTRASLAPLVAYGAPYWRLLAFEYLAVGQAVNNGLLDGSEVFTSNSVVMRLDDGFIVPKGF